MKRFWRLLLWIGLLLFVVGCGQNRPVIPTAVLQPIEKILPTNTPTLVPPTATAIVTAVSEEIVLPTITPAGQTEQTDEDTAVDETLANAVTIVYPAAGDDLFVGEAITLRGNIKPIPEVPLVLRVLALGGEELVRETAVIDDATGDWSATMTIPPQIVGSAQIMAQLEEQSDAVAVQVNLVPQVQASERYIIMHRPISGVTVVPGYAVLFNGEVFQPLDESVTIAIQSANCVESWTSGSIGLPNGSWQGWSVLPQTVTPGAACAIAFTGERGTESAREVRIPLTILDAMDDRVRSLKLGNAGDLLFTAGASAYIYGVAVRAPNNQVTVQLVSDNQETSPSTIAQGTAVANSFGYWELNLEIPADTPQRSALLVISMGEDDAYREVRQTVFVQGTGGVTE